MESFERLPDESDVATQLEERFIAEAIKRTQNAKPLRDTGFCLYCDEPAEAGRRFCDSACRDDHEHEQRMKKINGR